MFGVKWFSEILLDFSRFFMISAGLKLKSNLSARLSYPGLYRLLLDS